MSKYKTHTKHAVLACPYNDKSAGRHKTIYTTNTFLSNEEHTSSLVTIVLKMLNQKKSGKIVSYSTTVLMKKEKKNTCDELFENMYAYMIAAVKHEIYIIQVLRESSLQYSTVISILMLHILK